MADETILQLPTVTAISGNEYIPVVQGGVNKKASVSQLPRGLSQSFLVSSGDAMLLQERVLTAGSGISLTDAGAGSTLTVALTGAVAPIDATYVTISANSTLTGERVLTAGTGISVTDGGANSTVTLAAAGNLAALYNLASTGVVKRTGVSAFTAGLVDATNDLSGNLSLTNFNGGTSASAATFWRGDGTWALAYGTGTVTSVSVASANGLAGTVATATATPAITLSTSVTGVLKGNGTAISAAVAGTDYTTPTGAENLSSKTITGSTLNSTAIGGSSASTGDFTTISATGAITSTLATGSAPFVVASTTVVANLNASALGGATFASPGNIGTGTPGTGAFTTISATGAITSTLATGSAPFVVASTTNVANLNASSLGGATFASPGTIGGGTAAGATFTTLVAQASETLGVASTTSGQQIWKTSGSANSFSVNAGAFGASFAWTLPTAQGAASTFLQNNGSGTLSWVAGNSGTVTSVSVASANGFTGTVATATTTPAITLTTSISGVLKGNATAISAATAGTDYLSPTAVNLGTSASATGSAVWYNATNANTATINSGVTSASYSITLPTAQASGTQVLQNNGSGVLSWVTASSGLTASQVQALALML